MTATPRMRHGSFYEPLSAGILTNGDLALGTRQAQKKIAPRLKGDGFPERASTLLRRQLQLHVCLKLRSAKSHWRSGASRVRWNLPSVLDLRRRLPRASSLRTHRRSFLLGLLHRRVGPHCRRVQWHGFWIWTGPVK